MSGVMQGTGQSLSGDPSCDEAWRQAERLAQADDNAQRLARTIESEIIPRLMLLHRQSGRVDGAGALLPANGPGVAPLGMPAVISTEDVAVFTRLILAEHDPAAAFLKDQVARGATLDTLCLDLLAPAARRLGDMWDADECDFTQVTIALGRLHVVLRQLSADNRLMRATEHCGLTALFSPVTGEQHTFGLTMVCDIFRASGWAVWGHAPVRPEEVLDLVRQQAFDVVGFAIGGDRNIKALADLIRQVRAMSCQDDIRVLVGGPLLIARPQIAVLVGADGTAGDARQAMLTAQRLVAMRGERR
jgi:MerR family transcriptional regulator, light-induced transcriptional regulator